MEYTPFGRAPSLGLGIVIKITKHGSGDSYPLAEVLWMKYSGDGPQWYQVKSLRVVSSAPE